MALVRFALVALTMGLAGCGHGEMPTTKVNGTVTVDGVPASGGIVYFVPLEGPSAAGQLDSEGQFQLSTRGKSDGAVPGMHHVYFGPAYGLSEGDGMTASSPPPQTFEFPPPRYRSPENSGLSAEVTPNRNRYDFDLKSDKN